MSTEKIDRIVNLVGELVIAQAMMQQASTKLAAQQDEPDGRRMGAPLQQPRMATPDLGLAQRRGHPRRVDVRDVAGGDHQERTVGAIGFCGVEGGRHVARPGQRGFPEGAGKRRGHAPEPARLRE